MKPSKKLETGSWAGKTMYCMHCRQKTNVNKPFKSCCREYDGSVCAGFPSDLKPPKESRK